MLALRPRLTGRALAVAVLIALGAAGCGSGDGPPAGTTGAAPPATDATATAAVTPGRAVTVPGAFTSRLPRSWSPAVLPGKPVPEGGALYREQRAPAGPRGDRSLLVVQGPSGPGDLDAQEREILPALGLDDALRLPVRRTTVDGEPANRRTTSIVDEGERYRQTIVVVGHGTRAFVLLLNAPVGEAAQADDVLDGFLAAWRWS